ncbi:MAG: 4Fe-4S dicluster domain-containing protein [Bacteroidetes bacterium]|nr:4Fe-4S dicluster domain-containing protein [Bacteroidota bacterium]
MKEKKKKINRRKFIGYSGLITGGVLASSIAPSLGGILMASRKPKNDGPWYGIGIDIEKCIGCGNCAKTCKIENDVPKEPFFFRNWVEQYTLKKDGSMLIEAPNGGIDGFKQTEADENILKTFFVPKMCNHCAKSPCTQVCPVGATFESPEGIALIDEKYCIGCGYCIQACPYGCRYLHPDTDVADKCTLCYHRIKKGMNPACMDTCPTGARISGDLNDPESDLNKFLNTKNVQVLKPQMNTGSKLFYNALNREVK